MTQTKTGARLRPMLFSTAMVQAILDGRKTQTRRVVKPQHLPIQTGPNDYIMSLDVCPYGQPGDVIWVRETWCYVMRDHAHDLLEGARDRNLYVYKTSFHEDWMEYAKEKYGYKWRPSIHMPFAAARIFLRVKSVRVERLQAISRQDALSEGIQDRVELEDTRHEEDYYQYKFGGERYKTAVDAFSALWQSINGADSWDANPWVWVVEFERITKEEAGI